MTRFGYSLRPPPQALCGPDLPGLRPKRHRGDVQNPVELPSSVAPSSTRAAGAGMSTSCASPTPTGLGLAPG